jgi:hypothetical protein
MPFKNLKFVVLATVVSLILVNCSYFFEEKKKENEVVYNQEVGGCMSAANNTMVQYFATTPEAEPAEKDLREFSQCYNDSLESFITYTKSGRLESDDYSAENIETLIGKFHPGKNLSADRIRGYLKLKSFLIGGSEDSISKEELGVLQRLLPLLGDALRKLLPYRQILLRSARLDKTTEDYQKFQQAFQIFEADLAEFLKQLKPYEGRRQINMVELASFLFGELYGEEARNKANLIPLMVAFKNFAVSEDGEYLHREKLATFAKQTALTHKAIANFYYFLEDDSEHSIFHNIGNIVSFIAKVPGQLVNAELFKGLALKSLEDIMDTSEAVLRTAVDDQRRKRLGMDKFHEVLQGLETANIMKGPLTADTLNYFMANFFSGWVDPGNRVGSDLTLRKITDLRGLIDKWFQRQKMLNEVFGEDPEQTISLVRLNSSVPLQGAWNQWARLLEKIGVHQWDDKNRVQFEKDMSRFSYKELTVSNSIFLLDELFMRPYNRGVPNLLNYKLRESEVQEIYELVRVLGVELAFMDSRIVDSGERAFTEMNSFSTQVSNDLHMDFFEGYEYLSIASSSGKASDRLYDDISVQCRRDSIDVHNRRVIEVNCFRSHLKTHFLEYFGHLDRVSDFWRKANNLRKDEFLRSLEIASRAGVIREKPYDLTEIRVTVSILSYLESIFFRFDKTNVNNLVDGEEGANGESELRLAEAHFRPLVKDFVLSKRPEILQENSTLFSISCGEGLSDDLLLDCIAPKIFIHLLTNGGLPLGDSDVCGRTQFAWILIPANERRAFRNAEASPGNALKVFSALAKLTHQSHVDRVKDFLVNQQKDLFTSLAFDEAPDCLAQPDNIFCKWGRELYCNESVNPDVYEYFRSNKYNLFPVTRYDEDPEASVEQTLLDIFATFDEHQKFSTLCAFPFVEKERVAPGLQDVARDCVVGEPEQPSLRDRGQQFLDDAGQVWNNIFGGD